MSDHRRVPANQLAKLALTKGEAAEALSMSVDSFERHVMPELRVIRRGKLVLIPVRELERWVDRNSARALADHCPA